MVYKADPIWCFLFTKNILTGKPINVFNNGNHCRDFTFIDDIVEGITRTLDLPPTHNLSNKNINNNFPTRSSPYRVINIGNNNPVKLSK
jgi:UDP-glucuronate 4-epimerase